jgi:hypothetical protein
MQNHCNGTPAKNEGLSDLQTRVVRVQEAATAVASGTMDTLATRVKERTAGIGQTS